MGKPTVADLSADIEDLRTRLAALEDAADPEAFDDTLPLDEDEQAALALAEGERHAAIAAALALIEVEVHGDVTLLLKRVIEDHAAEHSTERGWVTVEMHDIEARARDDLRLALRNWCNAARRALAEAA